MSSRRYRSQSAAIMASLLLVATTATAGPPPVGPFEIADVTPTNEVKGVPDALGRPVVPGTGPKVPYALLRQGYAGEVEPNGTTATALGSL